MNHKDVIGQLYRATKLPKNQIAELLEVPSNPELGDLAFPCFALSKRVKKDPTSIAKDIKAKIKITKGSLIKEVKATGPYVNFFYDTAKLAEIVLKRIWKEKEKYGYREKKNKKNVVIEFPAPNTNKPLHLGHLRNMSLGECVARLLESQGYRVFRVNLNNDRGIHICKSMLAYRKWGGNRLPDKKPDHFVGDFYVMFSQKARKNPQLEEEAKEMLRKWEEGDPSTIRLWKKMNKWALEGFDRTYKRFGVKFDRTYYESETYAKGREIVYDGLKKGIFYKDGTGAVLVDLGKPLGKKVLLRADGTSVYITQDLYLAKLKYDEFKYDKSIYVVANEQNYHFEVLFSVLEKLGFKYAKGCYHLNYGMVYLPEGRMKSREGKVVDADTIMDELAEMARKEISLRHKTVKSDVLSEKIGLAALKYFLLKFSPYKDFTFRPRESISFEGETGPYLQYSLVRAKKIMQKVRRSPTINVDFTLYDEDEEIALIKNLSVFPELIRKSAEKYAPNALTEYAFKLAAKFNLFYEHCRVIGAENNDIQKARLLLVKLYSFVMFSCLHLLGIEVVEEM